MIDDLFIGSLKTSQSTSYTETAGFRLALRWAGMTT